MDTAKGLFTTGEGETAPASYLIRTGHLYIGSRISCPGEPGHRDAKGA